MGLKGKFKRALQNRKVKVQSWMQQEHDKRVYNRNRMVGLAAQCMKCKWFVYRMEKPRNWVCRAPDEKMKFKGNVCLAWDFGGHPEMVVTSSR